MARGVFASIVEEEGCSTIESMRNDTSSHLLGELKHFRAIDHQAYALQEQAST
jgi:hypothetical protein